MAKKKPVEKKAETSRVPSKKATEKDPPAVKSAMHLTPQQVKAAKPATKRSQKRPAQAAINTVESTVEADVPQSPAVQLDTSSVSAGQSTVARAVDDEARRHRAYLKWEAAGRPEGDGSRFWFEAEQELLQEQSL